MIKKVHICVIFRFCLSSAEPLLVGPVQNAYQSDLHCEAGGAESENRHGKQSMKWCMRTTTTMVRTRRRRRLRLRQRIHHKQYNLQREEEEEEEEEEEQEEDDSEEEKN